MAMKNDMQATQYILQKTKSDNEIHFTKKEIRALGNDTEE